MRLCTNCQRQLPAGATLSGVDYQEEVLCSACLKAAQKVCPHTLMKDDGITCRDCAAKPWTFGRVIKGTARGTRTAVVGLGKMFLMYTFMSITSSILTLAVLYFVGVSLGLFPWISISW